jgi:four helix bundle protein
MKNTDDNIIYNKSFNLALDIIDLYKYLCTYKKEYILSKQILRSGTSIGANISEALFAQTKRDFISKMHIALKETSETIYWINLLSRSSYIDENKTSRFLNSLDEISRILRSIITTSKENLEKKA